MSFHIPCNLIRIVAAVYVDGKDARAFAGDGGVEGFVGVYSG